MTDTSLARSNSSKSTMFARTPTGTWEWVGRRSPMLWAGLIFSLAFLSPAIVSACPFCTAVSQTIRQETAAMDAVVIASATQSDITRNPETGIVEMKIEKVLRGKEHVKVGQVVKAVYFGRVQVGRRFLLSGIDPPRLEWSCMPVTERGEKYIVDALSIGDDATARLRYYMQFLQDDEEMISRDAYDEFASAPYDAIKNLAPEIDRQQLLDWLQEPEMSAERKRLYFTMLGVCGSKEDLPLLETMLKAPKDKMTKGLDALIACYLTLAGEDGLPLVTKLFLANKKSPFSHSYAAIMAVRFHGTEGDVIPRSALSEAYHTVLERRELADMVIPDLAKWNDWSQVDRLVNLFKNSDADNNWVRVPIVNYLRACPLPKASEALEELKKLDPESVKRASVFFPMPVPVRDKDASTSSIRRKSDREEAGSGLGGNAVTDAVPKVAIAAGDSEAQRLADASPVGVIAASNGSPLADSAQSPNLWRMGYVLALVLSTIVIGQYLVLSGGPAGNRSAG